MTMEEDARKLDELRVIDLKTELEKRKMDKTGNKIALVDRLKKAMMDEGLDPDTHIFVFPDKKLEKSEKLPVTKAFANDEIRDDSNEAHDDHTVAASAATTAATTAKRDVVEAETAVMDERVDEAKPIAKNIVAEPVDKSSIAETKAVVPVRPVLAKVAPAIEQQQEQQQPKLVEDVKQKSAEPQQQEPCNKKKEDTPKTSSNITSSSNNNNNNNSSSGGGDDVAGATVGAVADGKAAAAAKTAAQLHMQKVLHALSRNLWITNISQSTRATELKQALSKHGKVIGAKVVINARYPGANCYGFVKMDSIADAERCISHLDRTELNGQTIRVEKVHPEHLNSLRRLPPGAAAPIPIIPAPAAAIILAPGPTIAQSPANTTKDKADKDTEQGAANSARIDVVTLGVERTTAIEAAPEAAPIECVERMPAARGTAATTATTATAKVCEAPEAVLSPSTDATEAASASATLPTPRIVEKAATAPTKDTSNDCTKDESPAPTKQRRSAITTATATATNKSQLNANASNTDEDPAEGPTDTDTKTKSPVKRSRSRQESIGTSSERSERSAKAKDSTQDVSKAKKKIIILSQTTATVTATTTNNRSGNSASNAASNAATELLTFQKIRDERERERARERERVAREEKRRREETSRQRAIELQQRREQARLDREREELRMEREKLERAKAELMHIERERQKLEREKLELEKMELQQVRMRMQEEERRASAAAAAAQAAAAVAHAAQQAGVKRSAPFTRDHSFDERRGGRGGGSGAGADTGGRRAIEYDHTPPAPRFSASGRDTGPSGGGGAVFGGKSRSPKHKFGGSGAGSGPTIAKTARMQHQDHVHGHSGHSGRGHGGGGGSNAPTMAMRSVHPGGTLSKYDNTSFDLSNRVDRNRAREREQQAGLAGSAANTTRGSTTSSTINKYSSNMEKERFGGRERSRSRSPHYRRDEGRRGTAMAHKSTTIIRGAVQRGGYDQSKHYKVSSETARGYGDSRSPNNSGSTATGPSWSGAGGGGMQSVNKSWTNMKGGGTGSSGGGGGGGGWHRSGSGGGQQLAGGGDGSRWFSSNAGMSSAAGSAVGSSSHRSGNSSGVTIAQQYSSGGGPSCPPPPGINNYINDRFDFKSSMTMRKY